MIKRLIVTGFLILLFSPVSQAKSLQEIQRLLASQSVVRGNFEQLRTMEMFSQPLASSGHFILHKKSGLLWQQTSPFSVNLILTNEKLSQQIGNQPAQIMTENENPMAFYFSHIFLSLFDGNTERLNQQFTSEFSEGQNTWTIELSPHQAPLNNVFSRITISGEQYVDQIELTEVRGDKTTIIFSQQTEQPENLTADERARFQL